MNEDLQFVDFSKYCPKCEYSELDEKFDPCNECLDDGANVQSERPTHYKEKTV